MKFEKVNNKRKDIPKKQIAKWLVVVLIICQVLFTTTSCKKDASNTTADETSQESTQELAANITEKVSESDMFTDRDFRTDYDESSSVHISLNGSTATADGTGVEISGSTITLTEEQTYILSGTLDNGMVIVAASDSAKLQLVFQGVAIHCETSAPLYILTADKVFVTLASGTENTLSSGDTFEMIDENNIDGAVFSKQDLTFNGSGQLTVTSPSGHGIVCKDDLVLTGGTYTVTSASHGMDANDSVRITGNTNICIDAGKDGIHAENIDDSSLGFVYCSGGIIEIEAEGDGVSAGSYLQVADGTFQIVTGGGSENGSKVSSDTWGGFRGGTPGQMQTQSNDSEESSTSMKGLKSTGDMLLSAGSYTIDTADDAVHANASITVNGGEFNIKSGDDAFHADETLTVTQGTINITESYEGMEALDVEIQGGKITIVADDDGLNAASGNDASGSTGGRDGMFGNGGPGAPGGVSGSSDGSITISGGTLHITASGDGIDANGTIAISGGTTIVQGPTQGDTATLDYDISATITGGTFIGTGASGMAQTFSDATQGVIAVNVGQQTAQTIVTLYDQAGNTLLSVTPTLSYSVVILSSPELVSGETYTLLLGSTTSQVTAK